VRSLGKLVVTSLPVTVVQSSLTSHTVSTGNISVSGSAAEAFAKIDEKF
jgi:hypothetical protein